MTPPVTPAPASASAGSRFLDALRRGELDAALPFVPAGATLRIAGVDHVWTGPEQIGGFLRRGLASRPEAAYKALTRHVGRGAVIDDVRLPGLLASTRPGDNTEIPAQVTIRERDGEIGSIHVAIPPIFLSALQGAAVDPLELSVAEMTVSLRPINDPSLTTIQLAEAKPVSVPQPPVRTPAPEEPKSGRRRGLLIGALVLLLLLGGGAFAYRAISGDATTPPPVAKPSPTVTHKPKPSTTPKPTPTPTSPTQTAKPTITLSANLAFGSDSATLSSSARQAIVKLARKARRGDVSGIIEVDGYTDSVGSAAHGLTLSRKRADAVAALLRSELSGLDITVISKGLGEANPVASNATETGRAKNRRVEIFLPDQ